MTTETVNTTRLVPKRVTLKPSKRHGWLPEDHDGAFRFSRTVEELTVQRDRHTGLLNTGLTAEDETRLEKALKLESGGLSRYNTEYWSKFKVKVPKEGIVLSPFSSPTDEVAWRVMLVHQHVANSLAEKNKTGFETYVMHSEEEEAENLNKEINTKLEAYKKLGEMSETQLVNFLKVYGKNPGKDSSLDFIKAQVGKIADTQPQYFLDTMNNPNYKMNVFIKNCLEKGILKEAAGKYFRPGGEALGYSIEQTIDFLSNRDNNEVYTLLKGQLEAVK
jgi:hypothetical protein